MIERYSRPEMAQIWTDAHRFGIWMEIELLAAEALCRQGIVPEEDLEACRDRAPTFDAAAVERIREIEATVKHDVIAFLTYVEEQVGEPSRWLHLGMTSSDVLDTALAVQIKEAGELLLADLDLLLDTLERRAHEHKDTVMIGRSHGVHAEPITFGLKLATFYDEFRRHRTRLKGALARAAVGKVSGAVGTFAHLSPAVEQHVVSALGIGYEPVATQVVQRDRHAEFFSTLAGIGASIERLAVEIRHLARTEVREVQEPFTAGQKGSSAMPHKRNPILSENLTGLARLLRGYAASTLENVALWHERDISHSSVERVVAPDTTILLDFALVRLTRLVEGLVVFPERMRENLEASKGMPFSQAILLELARRGLKRQEAYAIVQACAMRVWDEGITLKEACLASEALRSHLTPAEIEACFDLSRHLRHVDVLFTRVFGA
ncbi:MAG: adenylosuccinate lyase [Deltaproteobacteria bacterium]|nr:MAG: adenylosuccinate lyase [Deltaproteobacteria bacterium]